MIKHPNNRQVDMVCEVCREIFPVPPYRAKGKLKAKTCSNKCRWIRHGRLMNFTGKKTWITPQGYIGMSIGYDKVGYQHRVIMEKHLGRKLLNNEVVHHINGIRTDNRVENLMVMTQQEHTSMHSRERWARRRATA